VTSEPLGYDDGFKGSSKSATKEYMSKSMSYCVVVKLRGQFRDIGRGYLALQDQFRQDLARSRTLCDSPTRVSICQSRYMVVVISLTQIRYTRLRHLEPFRRMVDHDLPWAGNMLARLSSRHFQARILVIGSSLGDEVARLLWVMV